MRHKLQHKITHNKTILFVTLVALLFAACEKVLDVQPGEQMLVLNGVPSAGKQAFVNFSRTHFFLDTVNAQPVGSASMTLTVNGTDYAPSSVSGCNYFFPVTLQPDDQLAISVIADGRKVEASTYVPKAPQIDNMKVQYYESPSFNFYLATFNLGDHPGYQDLYSLKVEVRDSGLRRNDWTDSIELVDTVTATYFILPNANLTSSDVCPYVPLGGYLFSQIMFTDTRIEGENTPVELFIMKLVDTNEVAPFKHYYNISVETLTPDRWRYLISVAQASSMTSMFAEQGSPYTNVSVDGQPGLGIFAGNARWRYCFDVDTISDTVSTFFGKAPAILPPQVGRN